eukprot:2406909-Pleurochrysis_carterae.AAC.1
MEGTTTPEPSASRLRGAPASVVERQRSGSKFRGVAPWQIMRMGRFWRVEKMSNQPLACMRLTSFCREENPLRKEM